MKHNIVMLTSRIHDLTHSWLVDALAEAGLTGLAPSHGDVLACLFKEGEATMQKLAAFAHRTKPTTTVLVDKLEKMGLVRRERSEADARRTRVTLTDEGEALRPKFDDVSRRLVSLVYSGLSKPDAERLEALLEKTLSGIITQTERKQP